MKIKKIEKLLILIERFLPLVLMSAFIFIQSSKAAVAVSYFGWINFFIHKIAHIIVYSLLFLFATRAFKDRKIALIYTILFAISDEFHQSFIPTRNGSIADVLIDTAAASGVFYFTKKYQKKIPQVFRNFFNL
jgi:VanZ family protein